MLHQLVVAKEWVDIIAGEFNGGCRLPHNGEPRSSLGFAFGETDLPQPDGA